VKNDDDDRIFVWLGIGLMVLGVIIILTLIAAVAAGAATPSYSWGQFGEDGAVNPPVPAPVAVKGLPPDVIQTVTSNSATYMLTSSGAVWAYGADDFGQLGQGSASAWTAVPWQIPLPPIAFLPSPMPYATGLAVDKTGHIWGWGINQEGELCLGNTTDEFSPVMLPFVGVTAATGAGGHATYETASGLMSCGANGHGQLGDGGYADTTTPRKVAFSGPVSSLASGYGFTTILSAGTVYDFGLNNAGQLGDGTLQNSPVPVRVISGVESVTAGGNTHADGQTFVMLSNGTFEAWGSDGYGQLCDGREKSAVPRPEKLGFSPTAFSSGGATSFIIVGTNLWTCGKNTDGEAGIGAAGRPVVTPTQVLSGVSGVSATSENVEAQ
jgi:alpha-tubulin suppressor-like RCC1 family protein